MHSDTYTHIHIYKTKYANYTYMCANMHTYTYVYTHISKYFQMYINITLSETKPKNIRDALL